MHLGKPVETLAAAVYTAINDKEILADIEQKYGRQEPKMVRPSVYDISINHFPQLWGSTALGFGGIGGAAMTTAYTTVIVCRNEAAVFFDGRHAYTVTDMNEAFVKDLANTHMASLSDASKKY